MKYRIVKRTDILKGDKKPERREWYVIQRRIVTCMFLWIPMWLDCHFDNYPNSIMAFDDLEDAQKYLRELKEIQNE